MCLRGAMSIFKRPIMHLGVEKMKVIMADVEGIERRLQHEDYLFSSKVLYHCIQIMMLDFFDAFDRIGEEYNFPYKQLEVMTQFMGMLYGEAYIKHRKLEYYANKLNVTTKYLSDASRTFTERGASYWVNRFTTSKICYLLKSSPMSLSELADKFCFSSPSHFYVYFQKQIGMSPSEFRNKL